MDRHHRGTIGPVVRLTEDTLRYRTASQPFQVFSCSHSASPVRGRAEVPGPWGSGAFLLLLSVGRGEGEPPTFRQ